MRTIAALLVLCALACGRGDAPAAPTETVDPREPVGVWFVGAPELKVYARADEQSEVVATYQNGEAIPVLVQKGEWAEVRSGSGSGWAKMADLTTAAGLKEATENLQPKFRVMPLPVSAPGAHGEIYIEADVNTDGDVTKVLIMENTTGSDQLAQKNADALRRAKFYPIVIKNERRAFKYDHKVSY
ncbi:MAG TPA: SH3 domain-containing protein [Thermoanaerobaculia bacterium]|jgi:uncharacterized protein YgiM (DUF1202 family)